MSVMPKFLLFLSITLWWLLNLIQSYDIIDIVETSCLDKGDCMLFVHTGNSALCFEGKCHCMDSTGRHIQCKPYVAHFSNIVGGHCPCTLKNAECNTAENICYCNSSFIPSTDRRRCIKKVVRPNEPCELQRQCHAQETFSYCDLVTRKCTCRNGTLPYRTKCADMITDENIEYASCKDSFDCRIYDEKARCTKAEHRCVCDASYMKRPHNTTCIKAVYYLERCTLDTQCQWGLGKGARCVKGICRCDETNYQAFKYVYPKEVYEPYHYKCEPYVGIGQYCRNNTDCYQHNTFDVGQTMHCVRGECDCLPGYKSVNHFNCTSGHVVSLHLKNNFLIMILVFVFITLHMCIM